MSDSTQDALRKYIRELVDDELEEMTGTGAVDGFGTPFAFQGDSEANKKKRKASATAVDGYELVGEVKYGPRHPSYRAPIREGGDPYYAWRNDDEKTPKMKIGEAIGEMNNQLREMEKSVKRCRRLRSETNMATSDYWKRTNNALMKMESRMHSIAKMVRDMRG